MATEKGQILSFSLSRERNTERRTCSNLNEWKGEMASEQWFGQFTEEFFDQTGDVVNIRRRIDRQRSTGIDLIFQLERQTTGREREREWTPPRLPPDDQRDERTSFKRFFDTPTRNNPTVCRPTNEEEEEEGDEEGRGRERDHAVPNNRNTFE